MCLCMRMCTYATWSKSLRLCAVFLSICSKSLRLCALFLSICSKSLCLCALLLSICSKSLCLCALYLSKLMCLCLWRLALLRVNILMWRVSECDLTVVCRGMCYKKLGNFEESVKDYTNAIRLESNNGNFYYNRAISYMCLNPPDYEKALEDYDVAVKLSQAKYRPLFNRGNCLRKMGRIAESIVDLKQVAVLSSLLRCCR